MNSYSTYKFISCEEYSFLIKKLRVFSSLINFIKISHRIILFYCIVNKVFNTSLLTERKAKEKIRLIKNRKHL